jgi:hypothetical protein
MEKGPSTKGRMAVGLANIPWTATGSASTVHDPLGDHSVFSKALESPLRNRAEGKDRPGVNLRKRILNG